MTVVKYSCWKCWGEKKVKCTLTVMSTTGRLNEPEACPIGYNTPKWSRRI